MTNSKKRKEFSWIAMLARLWHARWKASGAGALNRQLGNPIRNSSTGGRTAGSRIRPYDQRLAAAHVASAKTSGHWWWLEAPRGRWRCRVDPAPHRAPPAPMHRRRRSPSRAAPGRRVSLLRARHFHRLATFPVSFTVFSALTLPPSPMKRLRTNRSRVPPLSSSRTRCEAGSASKARPG